MRKGSNRSDATTLTIDRDGRVYAATPEGVQVFDPTGRLCGVLLPPERAPVTDVWLGDDKLFVTCGDKEFKRKLNTRGVQ
jgi:enterochelin esterase family protein